MSLYRNFFAALAAAVVISPVFADDTAQSQQGSPAQVTPKTEQQQPAQPAAQQASGKATLASNDAAATTEQGKVNLNKATVKELLKVKGINKSQARAIVAYRKKHGDFKSLEDLNNVKSLKKKPLDKAVEDQLSIQ